MSTDLFARKDSELPGQFSPAFPPTPSAVRAQVEKIRNSEPFIRSLQIQRLLEFLVESVLAGHENRLKETVIGIEVFDRAPDYDCKVDPVVRVEMRRLRSKLSEYYLSEGPSDDVFIWLKKGSYVPSFLTRVAEAATSEPPLLTPAAQLLLPDRSASATPVRASANLLEQIRKRRLWLIGGAFAAVLVTAGVFIKFVMPPSENRQPSRVFPLTGNAGLEISPAFSPDGQKVAYSWDGNRQNFDIYIRKIAGGAPQRLTDSAAHDVHPSWSPDGRRLAFFRVSPQKSELVVIPATSGVEQVIGEVPVPASKWHPAEPEQDGASGPVWSTDGSYLLVSGYIMGRSSLGILKMSLNGSSQVLTHPDKQENDLDPSISPDGRYIAFTRNWGSNSSDLFIVAAQSGQPVRLTFDSRDIRGVAWLDADHLIYSSEHKGSFRLWSISRTGGDSRPVSVSGANPQWPAISPDGHWLAFVEATNDASIWRLPFQAANPSSAAESFIVSAGADHSPAYSPDGKRIAFISNRSGSWQIWVADSDGTDIRQLTDFKGSSVGTPRWSPDSRRLVFDALLEGPSAIWLIDADGNNLHRLNNSPTREYMPTWSRDGQWIYFSSLHDGQDQLYKQQPDTGQIMPLTQNFFHDAVESAQGNTLYMQRRDAGLWQMPLPSGAPTVVPELNSIHPVRYWTLAGEKLYFVRQERSPRELEVLDLITRQTSKLADIPGELLAGTPGLAVDPGGRWLLFVQKNQLRSSIMLQER